MKYIGKNEELLFSLSGDTSLQSSKLYRIDIHSDVDKGLIIELYIELLYARADKQIKIIFNGIKEFSLYYNHTYYFYNIERYKFFRSGDRFYISLDPYSEDEVISPEDQDFILGTEIEGYYI